MVESLNYAYERGQLSNSQKQAVITLLEKKRQTEKTSNFRPICLINEDEKMSSKAIAKRLEIVLPNTTHHNQFAYVKSRTIFIRVTSCRFAVGATTGKRQLGSDNLEATTWKRQRVTLIGFRTLSTFHFGPSFI